MINKITTVLLFLSFSITQTFAQSAQEDPKLWTPEDIINTESMRSPIFSPDATMVVWSKRIPVKKKDKFVSNLFSTGFPLRIKLGTGSHSFRKTSSKIRSQALQQLKRFCPKGAQRSTCPATSKAICVPH